jgi:hypothetical protein
MRAVVAWVVWMGVAACNLRSNVPCAQSADCDLSSGGVCVAAATGNMWCAYPDTACPGGYRFSDQAIGDGLSGSCVPDTGVDAGVDAPVDTHDAPVGPATFAVTYGGTASESVASLGAVAGGVLVVGTLASNATLGTTALTYGGGADFVRAKLDSSGAVVWAVAQNDTDQEQLAGMDSDTAGDMVIAGTFAGTVNFGGAALASSAGNYDLFVAKYAGATGGHVWSQRYGGATEEHALAICVDPAGDAYIVGYFLGTTNLGGANQPSAGAADGFVAKYRGTDGAFLWGARFGGTDNDYAETVACDAARVVVGGRFRSATINLGGADLMTQGQDDIFLAAFSAAGGSHLWSARHGGASNDDVVGVAVSGGSVYVTGSFTAPLGLGGITLTSQGAADVYVAKYDGSTGSHTWSKRFGGTGLEVPGKVIAADAGIVIVGRFSSALDVGGGELSSAGGDDVFVATLAQSDGAYVDAWRTGGTQNDFAAAVASTPTGLVVGGGFGGINYFGSLPRTSTGAIDGFVFRP